MQIRDCKSKMACSLLTPIVVTHCLMYFVLVIKLIDIKLYLPFAFAFGLRFKVVVVIELGSDLISSY